MARKRTYPDDEIFAWEMARCCIAKVLGRENVALQALSLTLLRRSEPNVTVQVRLRDSDRSYVVEGKIIKAAERWTHGVCTVRELGASPEAGISFAVREEAADLVARRYDPALLGAADQLRRAIPKGERFLAFETFSLPSDRALRPSGRRSRKEAAVYELAARVVAMIQVSAPGMRNEDLKLLYGLSYTFSGLVVYATVPA
jgi:hypothetical protein